MVHGSTDNVDQLMYVMKHLFYQQRCGMRRRLSCRSRETINAGIIAKTILLRQTLFAYLKKEFAKIEEELLDVFCGFGFYEKFHGVDTAGTLKDNVDGDGDGGASDGGASDCDHIAVANPHSMYPSGNMLVKVMRDLANNKYERRLVDMAKAQTKLGISLTDTVDLTNSAARSTSKVVEAIRKQYFIDFCLQTDADHTSDPSPASGGDVVDESTYKKLMKKWEQDVQEYEDRQCMEYIQQHIYGTIVDEMTNGEKVGRKVENVIAAVREVRGVKRKLLLVHDDLCARSLDWSALKRRRTSSLQSKTWKMEEESMEVATDAFNLLRGCM